MSGQDVQPRVRGGRAYELDRALLDPEVAAARKALESEAVVAAHEVEAADDPHVLLGRVHEHVDLSPQLHVHVGRPQPGSRPDLHVHLRAKGIEEGPSLALDQPALLDEGRVDQAGDLWVGEVDHVRSTKDLSQEDVALAEPNPAVDGGLPVRAAEHRIAGHREVHLPLVDRAERVETEVEVEGGIGEDGDSQRAGRHPLAAELRSKTEALDPRLLPVERHSRLHIRVADLERDHPGRAVGELEVPLVAEAARPAEHANRTVQPALHIRHVGVDQADDLEGKLLDAHVHVDRVSGHPFLDGREGEIRADLAFGPNGRSALAHELDPSLKALVRVGEVGREEGEGCRVELRPFRDEPHVDERGLRRPAHPQVPAHESVGPGVAGSELQDRTDG